MKIGIIRRECGLGLGGAERYCANVALTLDEMGHEVAIISNRSALPGIAHISAPVHGRGSIAKNLSFFRSVANVLKTHNFDIIYGLSRIEGCDFLRISDPLHASWLDLGYRDRLIPPWIRKKMPRHSTILAQEKRAINSAKVIITNSDLVRKQVLQYYQKDPERVVTIYNGVDLSRFRPASPEKCKLLKLKIGIKAHVPLIIFPGSDYKRKGLIPLMEALSSIRKWHHFHLLVLGVKGHSHLLKLSEKFKIQTRITFGGFRRNMQDFYCAGELVCLPTFYDPFANVCLESLACGTPVLTTMQNGAWEIVSKVDESLVVKRPEPKEIASSLSSFLSLAKGERDALREKSSSVAKKFTWERHASRLIELFTLFNR